ncbi:tyrosine-type recombinase/integrase [Stenotrophomonas maltophilia]|nr:site-specific integrase [Stenotrophomonas maltophilia]QGL66592.1 site-specific integrase [Stenotrophomonas maltophilia]
MSQAIGIRWSEVVDQGGRLHVRFWRHATLKKGRPRTLPCTARVAEVLQRRKDALAATSDGPFTMLNRTRADRLWQWAIKGTHLASEKECVPHALRHTCATRLLLATGNIKLVQEWLGHRDIQTTSAVYAKVLAEQSLQGMSALEQFRLPAASNGTGDVPRQGSIAKAGIQ